MELAVEEERRCDSERRRWSARSFLRRAISEGSSSAVVEVVFGRRGLAVLEGGLELYSMDQLDVLGMKGER